MEQLFIVLRQLPGPQFDKLCIHTFFIMGKQAKNTLHIGSLIESKIKLKGMTYAEFARRLNCNRTTVYNIVRSSSIDTERLRKISQILEYDFLREIQHPEEEECVEFDIPEEMIKQLREKDIQRITIRISSNPTIKASGKPTA